MKSILKRVFNGRAAVFAAVILLQLFVGVRLEAPVLTPSESEHITAAQHHIAKVLEPGVPLTLTSLEMPVFHRARELMLSRGTLARYETRSFPDVIARHVIELCSDEDEIQNVRLAAEAVNGVVLMPYETFSFNGIVGHRTEWKGYKPGLMFQNGQVVSGIGGGICIVSTALYNAALCSGLKIIERTPHSGRVRYAEPGLDAAVVYDALDLKFKNDTDRPILIQTILDRQFLKVKFFGRWKSGREIEIVNTDYREIPYKVIEKQGEAVSQSNSMVDIEPRTGYEVTTIRIFKENGRIINREVIAQSVVPPRHKVVILSKTAQPVNPFHRPADQETTVPTPLPDADITPYASPITDVQEQLLME